MQISMFSLEERPASPSVSPDSEKDWMIRVATSCLPTLPLLTAINPSGYSGKMSPVSCPHGLAQRRRVTWSLDSDGIPRKQVISDASWKAWQNSGMGSPTEFWTLSSCEQMDTLTQFPKDGAVCSLSDVLEVGNVPQRYFLTAKACAGILRRAEKRGKKLPEPLKLALERVADGLTA